MGFRIERHRQTDSGVGKHARAHTSRGRLARWWLAGGRALDDNACHILARRPMAAERNVGSAATPPGICHFWMFGSAPRMGGFPPEAGLAFRDGIDQGPFRILPP